jgi:hypothetical protein
VTDLRLVNRWLALAGGALSCALSFYIWLIVGEARGLSDLFLALAQCSLVAIGGYLAASILLQPGLQRSFGYLALLLPALLWAATFLSLIPVALGYWPYSSKSPMLVFELMLGVQGFLLALGAVIFELIAMLSRYLTSRATPTPPAAEAPPSAPGERRR